MLYRISFTDPCSQTSFSAANSRHELISIHREAGRCGRFTDVMVMLDGYEVLINLHVIFAGGREV